LIAETVAPVTIAADVTTDRRSGLTVAGFGPNPWPSCLDGRRISCSDRISSGILSPFGGHSGHRGHGLTKQSSC